MAPVPARTGADVLFPSRASLPRPGADWSDDGVPLAGGATDGAPNGVSCEYRFVSERWYRAFKNIRSKNYHNQSKNDK